MASTALATLRRGASAVRGGGAALARRGKAAFTAPPGQKSKARRVVEEKAGNVAMHEGASLATHAGLAEADQQVGDLFKVGKTGVEISDLVVAAGFAATLFTPKKLPKARRWARSILTGALHEKLGRFMAARGVTGVKPSV